MQFLMLTKVTEEGAAHFEALDDSARAADIAAHLAWFERHADSIGAGYELAYPQEKAIVSRTGITAVTDGPFAEAKERIGGVIVLEVDTLDRATTIAAEWPSLTRYPGATVEVVAVAG